MEDLVVPGAEFLVLDTNVFLQPYAQHEAGVYLGLHGSLLVLQAAENAAEDSAWGILLVDLDTPRERRFLALRSPEDQGVTLLWPAISDDYVVWTRMVGFFTRTAWAQRLVDGRPFGEAFEIGPGGTEITISRNIAVWNGAARLEGEEGYRSAVIAAELDLPGADDVGDVDQDGGIDITDAIVLLNYLFRGGPRPRLRPADADLNRALELTDAVVILQYLFGGGPRPGSVR